VLGCDHGTPVSSNVEVVRRGLRLLAETTERKALKEAYRRASKAARSSTSEEISAFDHLAGEGVD